MGFLVPVALPVPADRPRCESAVFLIRAFENHFYGVEISPKNEHGRAGNKNMHFGYFGNINEYNAHLENLH